MSLFRPSYVQQYVFDWSRMMPVWRTYSIDGIEYRDPNERAPIVTVSKDGPYLITGGIELIRGDADNNIIQFGAKKHYTLRCGASNNKPFCDGMHKVINFKDDRS
ncbi:MAG: CDGSH iron-sulfur domain-containing protein [Thermoproteota archaeon]|nr:CDGSH iron-sulfur domain-containing protein [Thermoproteota archaeon]